ncbi:MAG: translation initiation factor IF-2, partial [Atopobiaceae bacterium]|nr:translation initiation factor IF-2 [Atopobiaceae bacterium]
DLKPRAPVVTVMGHVDHGKTSLLDAIRHTGVAAGEAGGITQAIGASQVSINGRPITFVDTPGHETFTAMRARGAKVTDIVVLVVAADDGVMPQTIESINHAKAAGVPIVVAVNKIDREDANPDRVRQDLNEYGGVPEEWGGENMFVNISAKQHIGIDELLETILLQAEVLELKANPDTFASGYVLEAKLDRGRGSVATVLVNRGTLHVGDSLVAGMSYGRVRAMLDQHGKNVTTAGPSDAIEILGLSSVPSAGDEFRVFQDERDARDLAEQRALKARIEEQNRVRHVTLENLFQTMEDQDFSELNLVIKADVQGSIEALVDSLAKMDQSEVRLNVIHSAVGAINETDVTLADASNAIIIGFGVRPEAKARAAAERQGVQIRTYSVIYKAIEDIDAARIGMLKPTEEERGTGSAEVREVFRVPRVGFIAGCMVNEGEISRNDNVRLVRNGIVIYTGKFASMRRYKDDVTSVRAGYACGLGLEHFQAIHIGDILEGFIVVEVARTE